MNKLGVDSVYAAMFNEVEEGADIFMVTSLFPAQDHFVGYEELPSDWRLGLTGEAGSRMRQKRPILF